MERFFSQIMNRWGVVSAIIELGRPWNGISVALLGIIGSIIAFQAIPPIPMLLITGTIIFTIYTGASILNDYFDVEVDRINMPYRPLQKGKINKETALIASLIFYCIGIMTPIFISFNFFLAILLMSVLSIIYSAPPFRMESKGFLGNVVLGVNMIFTSMYSGYVISTNILIPSAQFLISVGSFTIAFILLNVMKDVKDIQGDKMHEKYTVAPGFSKTILVSIGLGGTIMILISSFIFNMFYFQNVAFVLISLGVSIGLVASIYNLYKKFSPRAGETAWAVTRLLSLIYILNIFAFSVFTFI